MVVLMFEKRFWQAVSCGEKVHTIRQTHKRGLSIGDKLSLRGWEGKAYRSKQCVLCDETCLNVTPIWIDGMGVHIDGIDRIWWDDPECEAFAKSDGFESVAEFQAYFAKPIKAKGFFSGDLIQWGIHPVIKSLGANNAQA